MLYILVLGVLTGILPYRQLNVASPVSFSLISVGLRLGGRDRRGRRDRRADHRAAGAAVGQSRIFFAMSRDGLLPAAFARSTRAFARPYLSSGLIGVVVAAVAAVGKLDVVADLVNVGTLAAFVLVSIGVVILRRRRPDMERKFRVPASPLVPVLSAVLAVVLAVKGLPPRTLISYLVWLAIGLVVYFTYSRRRSVVGDEAAWLATAYGGVRSTRGESRLSRSRAKACRWPRRCSRRNGAVDALAGVVGAPACLRAARDRAGRGSRSRPPGHRPAPRS